MNAQRVLLKTSLLLALLGSSCLRNQATGKSGPDLERDSRAILLLIQAHKGELNLGASDLTSQLWKLNKGVPAVDRFGNDYFVFYVAERKLVIVASAGPDGELASADDQVTIRSIGEVR